MPRKDDDRPFLVQPSRHMVIFLLAERVAFNFRHQSTFCHSIVAGSLPTLQHEVHQQSVNIITEIMHRNNLTARDFFFSSPIFLIFYPIGLKFFTTMRVLLWKESGVKSSHLDFIVFK